MLKNIKDNLYYYYLIIICFLFPIIPKDLGTIFGFIHIRLLLLLGIIIISLYEFLFIKKEKKKINKPLTILIAIIFIFMLLGFFNSISKITYIYTYFKFAIFILSGYTLFLHDFEKKQIENIFNSIITSSLLTSIIGIYQYINHTNINLNGIYKYPGSTGRIISTFYNPIYLGIFLLFTIIIILYKLSQKNSKRNNLLYYITFIIIFIALLLTYTRTVAVLSIISMFIFVLYSTLQKNLLNLKKYLVILLTSIIILLSIPGAKYLYTSTITSFLPEGITSNIFIFANKYLNLNIDLSVYNIDEEETNEKEPYIDASNETRSEFSSLAKTIVKDYKLTGVGLGNYEKFVKKNIEKYEVEKFGYPHNSYLHLMAESGIIPGIILIIITLSLIFYTGSLSLTKENISALSVFIILLCSAALGLYESLIYDTQLCPILIIISILLIKINYINNPNKEIMFISSVGGHLTQLLELKKLFNEYNYVLVTEKTDVTKDMKNKYEMEFLVYGSREYLFTYFFKFTYNIIKSLILFIKYNPKIIITTGAHTAVPMCYIARLFGKKVIFIESYAKRNSPTLSGRLVYPIATIFIVQWESMLKYYPKAKFFGGIY